MPSGWRTAKSRDFSGGPPSRGVVPDRRLDDLAAVSGSQVEQDERARTVPGALLGQPSIRRQRNGTRPRRRGCWLSRDGGSGGNCGWPAPLVSTCATPAAATRAVSTWLGDGHRFLEQAVRIGARVVHARAGQDVVEMGEQRVAPGLEQRRRPDSENRPRPRPATAGSLRVDQPVLGETVGLLDQRLGGVTAGELGVQLAGSASAVSRACCSSARKNARAVENWIAGNTGQVSMSIARRISRRVGPPPWSPTP